MSMTSDRTTRIVSIIEKRQPLVNRIASVEANLGALEAALQDIGTMHDQLLEGLTDPLSSRRPRSFDVQFVRVLIEAELESLAKLRSRFARETINIGVMGMARQGKSKLLQSLSGLTTNDIPDGRKTGFRSTIYHDAQAAPQGEIFFHSEKSFIADVIGPYFRELKLEPTPRSLRDFADSPLPSLSSAMKSVVAQAKYEHLKKYRNHFDDYAYLLGSPPRRMPIKQVRAYVARDTVDGRRIYFNYLAVREVKIFCCFPHEDVGRIALIDMPGLSDTGIGDEERLIAALGQDVDAVLFVKRPNAVGGIWSDSDIALYEKARQALTDLPIEQWSFMVLNRTAHGSVVGDNDRICIQLASDITNHYIHVTQCIIADCSNTNETREKILDTVLNYLAQNINMLDQQCASACQERLNWIHNEFSLLLENAATTLGRGTIVEGEFVKFDQLFKEVWTGLSNSMESLLIELREQSIQPDD